MNQKSNKSNKSTLALVLLLVGLFLTNTCMVPASPLQLLAYVGFVCVIAGAVISVKEAIRLIKSKKKDDEETKNW